jgi:hypothetical protein
MNRWIVIAGSVIATQALASSALAAEIFPSISAGVLHTDNVDRGQAGGLSDTLGTATLNLQFGASSSRFFADGEASVTHQQYLEDSYPATTLPQISLTAFGDILPGRLRWTVDEDLGQVADTPFGALEPADREDINVFSTGPDLILPVGGTNAAVLAGRFTDVSYSQSDVDSERINGSVHLRHDFSELKNVGVVYDHTEVRFDFDEIYSNYDIDSAFIRYETETRSITAAIDLGGTRLKNNLDTFDGKLLGITLYKNVGAFSQMGIDYREGFSDASDTFRFGQRGALGGTGGGGGMDQNVLIQAAPFKQKRLTVEFLVDKPRWTASLSGFQVDEDYTDVNVGDRELLGGELALGLKVSSRSTWQARTQYEREDQIGAGASNNVMYGIDLLRQMSRSLRVTLGYERYDRTGSAAQLFDAKENRVSASLVYEPRGPREDPGQQFFPTRAVPMPRGRTVTGEVGNSPGAQSESTRRPPRL